MTLTAYYDGSGKADGSAFITLAGIAAPAELWPSFDALWREALKKHHLLWWHTADAMQGRQKHPQFVEPEYCNTWNEEKAQAAFDDLNRLVFTFLGDHYKEGLQIRSCTVNMAGYRAAQANNPCLRAAEAICVNSCVGNLALHNPGARIHLYFDRGESFLRYIDQVWRHSRKRQRAGWPLQVDVIEPAIASDVCGLQAADLIAWERNWAWHRVPDEIQKLSVFGISWQYYDQDAIEEAYPPDKERGRIDRLQNAGLRTSETERKD